MSGGVEVGVGLPCGGHGDGAGRGLGDPAHDAAAAAAEVGGEGVGEGGRPPGQQGVVGFWGAQHQDAAGVGRAGFLQAGDHVFGDDKGVAGDEEHAGQVVPLCVLQGGEDGGQRPFAAVERVGQAQGTGRQRQAVAAVGQPQRSGGGGVRGKVFEQGAAACGQQGFGAAHAGAAAAAEDEEGEGLVGV